jgi:cell wall-associated NlpC family hydrolase
MLLPVRRVLPLALAAGGLLAASAAAQELTPDAPVRLTRGETVRLQRALRVRADGVIGPRTRAAIRRVERRAALAVDGRPDAMLLQRLGVRAASVFPSAVLRPAPVRDAPASAPAPEAPAAPGPGAPAAAAAMALQAARATVGAPYRSGGEGPDAFDCSGLTRFSYAHAGVDLPHSSFAQAELGTAVDRAAIQAGDLVLFDTAGDGASDVGIASAPTTVISATTKGVKEHEIFDAYWGAHFVGARRLSALPPS